jgi:branched-chain amino acid transport system ATP-binding protein
MGFLLDLKDVKASYGKIQVLHGITFSMEKGEIVAFLGSNGAGKSTLLKAISGGLRPIEGTIYFDGQDVSHLLAHKIVQKGIVLVPEGRALFAEMTVEENLDMGAFALKDEELIEKQKHLVFDMFPILKQRISQLAGTLSGGEQQQLAIARSLMSSPRIIMLDEPSLGLAPKIVEEVYGVIKSILKLGEMSFLLVEQNIVVALKVVQKGYILENGKISLQGDSFSLLNNNHVKKAYLGM